MHTITELKFLEATLESGPQLVIQLTYLVQKDGDNIWDDPFFVVSIISSFYNLASAINGRDNEIRNVAIDSFWGIYHLTYRIFELAHRVIGYTLLAVRYSTHASFALVVTIFHFFVIFKLVFFFCFVVLIFTVIFLHL